MSKSSKYKDLSKNTLLFAINSFGTKIISFLLVPLYTYILSTKDYGSIDVVNTTVQLLIPVISLNIQDAVLRFSLDKEYDAKLVLGAGLRIIGASGLVLGTTLFFIRKIGLLNLDTRYCYYLFLTYFFGVLYNCLSMYLKAKNRVSVLVVSGLLNTFLTCFLSIILLLVVKMGVTGYLISNVSGIVIAVIIILIFGNVRGEVKFVDSNTILHLMITYSLPLVVNSIAWWLNNASDRYILTYFSGVDINGMYAVAYKIPTILATIQTIFYNAWSVAAITEFDKDDNDGFIGNVYSLYSAASVVVCSVLLLGNIIIAHVLYKGAFFEAWKYVPLLLVGTVFNGIALFEGCIFIAVKCTKNVSITTLCGALVNTILNFSLIPFFGAYGAAIATMLGYITIWAIRSLQLRSIVKIKVEWKIQFLTLFVLIIQSVLALFNELYYIQILFLSIILVLQRKQFIKILSFVKLKFNK